MTLCNNNDTSLLATIPNGINSDGLDTPNYLPGDLQVNTDARNGRSTFNTSLFGIPEAGTLGTAARRFFYWPGMANFDVALTKGVQFWETRSADLRIEAFNVFNHAQFFGAADYGSGLARVTRSTRRYSE